MFRTKGKRRTYLHNLKLASILSAVAGIVNIVGVLKLSVLTTNVTGHFAFFSEEFVFRNLSAAYIYLLYILSFLLGAFISNLIMEGVSRYKPQRSYIIPIFLEITILVLVGFSATLVNEHLSISRLLPSALLFAMGLQNALVTRVSRSVVRTTHLTGLFTDLGIELSERLFYKRQSEKTQLNQSIFLKLAIISCFFLGGIIGGLTYPYLELKTLMIPVGLLFFALWYDRLLFRYHYLRRKFRRI